MSFLIGIKLKLVSMGMGKYKIDKDLVFFEEEGGLKICVLTSYADNSESLNDLRSIFTMLIGEGES